MYISTPAFPLGFKLKLTLGLRTSPWKMEMGVIMIIKALFIIFTELFLYSKTLPKAFGHHPI